MPAYDVLHDAAGQLLNAQLATADAIDAKAATIFSVASTVAAIVPALLPLGKKGLEFGTAPFFALVAGGMLYAATAVLFVRAYRPGEWKAGPKPSQIETVCGSRNNDYALRWIAEGYLLSVRQNERELATKIKCLNWSIVTFVLQVIALIVAAISTLVQ